jgi:hypothetical protein
MCSRVVLTRSSHSRLRVLHTRPLVASFNTCLLRTHHESSTARVHHYVVESTNLLGMMSTFCWCVARLTACAWCLGLNYALANLHHYVDYRHRITWLEKLNALEMTSTLSNAADGGLDSNPPWTCPHVLRFNVFLNSSDSLAFPGCQHLSGVYNVKLYLYLPEGDSRNSRQPGSRRTFLPQRSRRSWTSLSRAKLG